MGKSYCEILLIGIMLLNLSEGIGYADSKDFKITGYYKNLLQYSETLSSKEFFMDLNRLRLEVRGSILKNLKTEIYIDNEWIVGNVLKTDAFLPQKKCTTATVS
ncbi:MAG: hypothetical protein HY099_01220 [Nitrospirae bacterium]|nr:hypothetical protein [Nitrospirota bacterium]